jgi:hypothetical protein
MLARHLGAELLRRICIVWHTVRIASMTSVRNATVRQRNITSSTWPDLPADIHLGGAPQFAGNWSLTLRLP